MTDENTKLSFSMFEQMGFTFLNRMPQPESYIADRHILVAYDKYKDYKDRCTERTSVYLTQNDKFIIRHEYLGSRLAHGYKKMSSLSNNHSEEITTLAQYLKYLDQRRKFTDPNPKKLDDEFFYMRGFRKEGGPILMYRSIRIPQERNKTTKDYETCKIYKCGNNYRAKIEHLKNSDSPEIGRKVNHISEILVTTQDFYDYVHQQRAITR